MNSRETLLAIGKLPRDTADPYERMALLAYDRGCAEGHGPYKSIAWDLAVEIYRMRPSYRDDPRPSEVIAKDGWPDRL